MQYEITKVEPINQDTIYIEIHGTQNSLDAGIWYELEYPAEMFFDMSLTEIEALLIAGVRKADRILELADMLQGRTFAAENTTGLKKAYA